MKKKMLSMSYSIANNSDLKFYNKVFALGVAFQSTYSANASYATYNSNT